MTTRRFLLLTLGCATLLPGASYARPSDPASQQAPVERSSNPTGGDQRDVRPAAPVQRLHGNTAARPGRRHGAAASNGRNPGSQAAPVAQQPLSPQGAGSTRPGSESAPEQTVRKPDSMARESFASNERIRRLLPVQPAAAAAPSEIARHRGTNPAVVGGNMIRTTAGSGALNGTGASGKR